MPTPANSFYHEPVARSCLAVPPSDTSTTARTSLAGAAPDAALEVVVVLTLPLPGPLSLLSDVLGAAEGVEVETAANTD